VCSSGNQAGRWVCIANAIRTWRPARRRRSARFSSTGTSCVALAPDPSGLVGQILRAHRAVAIRLTRAGCRLEMGSRAAARRRYNDCLPRPESSPPHPAGTDSGGSRPKNPPIKRRQATLMPDRQIEQDGIGQLVMSPRCERESRREYPQVRPLAARSDARRGRSFGPAPPSRPRRESGSSPPPAALTAAQTPSASADKSPNPPDDSPQTSGGPPDGGHGSATPKRAEH